MSELNIKMAAGSSVRLLTAGKQCDDIIVTVRGGSSEDVTDMELQFINYIQKSGTITKIPSNLTKIGNYAFYNYTNLALTSLPDGITSIGEHAFEMSSIVLKSLPNSLRRIGSSAFSDCAKLTELTFNGTPEYIASDAFIYCNNIQTINVPWAEGEVANAPWAASNATINYNYTELSV